MLQGIDKNVFKPFLNIKFLKIGQSLHPIWCKILVKYNRPITFMHGDKSS